MPSKLNSDIWSPTLAASLANSAATLPPEGEQFAPWDGPAALMFDPPTLAALVRSSIARRERDGAHGVTLADA